MEEYITRSSEVENTSLHGIISPKNKILSKVAEWKKKRLSTALTPRTNKTAARRTNLYKTEKIDIIGEDCFKLLMLDKNCQTDLPFVIECCICQGEAKERNVNVTIDSASAEEIDNTKLQDGVEEIYSKALIEKMKKSHEEVLRKNLLLQDEIMKIKAEIEHLEELSSYSDYFGDIYHAWKDDKLEESGYEEFAECLKAAEGRPGRSQSETKVETGEESSDEQPSISS